MCVGTSPKPDYLTKQYQGTWRNIYGKLKEKGKIRGRKKTCVGGLFLIKYLRLAFVFIYLRQRPIQSTMCNSITIISQFIQEGPQPGQAE